MHAQWILGYAVSAVLDLSVIKVIYKVGSWIHSDYLFTHLCILRTMFKWKFILPRRTTTY